MCTSIPVYPQMLCAFNSFVDDKFVTKKSCAVIFGQKCTSLVSSGSAARHLS